MTLISEFGGLRVPSGALMSACGKYRFSLWRSFPSMRGERGVVNFLMLNPSTADHEKDDPTIRRCIGYARAWGYGKLIITNIFALRSTDPRVLNTHEDPVGDDNDLHIVEEAQRSQMTVLAWGNHGQINGRGMKALQLLIHLPVTLSCLGKNKTGEPVHPLYQARDLKPIPLYR